MGEAIKPDEVIEPESDFGRVSYLIMDSYRRNKGRTLGTDQVQALGDGMLNMAQTIEMAKNYTLAIEALIFKMGEELGLKNEEVYNLVAQIQQGVPVEDIEVKKRKFWTP